MVVLNLACSAPTLFLIPGDSNLSNPIQIRRDEDFYVTTKIEVYCNASLIVNYQWVIKECSFLACSHLIASNLNQMSTSNEYYIPARVLNLGLYQLQLTVTMNISSNLRFARSIYILITAAGITANLVPLGTSVVTKGSKQNLQFNPGLYSSDLDQDQSINASVRKTLSFAFLIISQLASPSNGIIITSVEYMAEVVFPMTMVYSYRLMIIEQIYSIPHVSQIDQVRRIG
jgi:REJ domain